MSANEKQTVLTGKKLEDTFNAATETIKNLPKNGSFQPSNELLLKFYGYFKHATCGSCNKPRPGMFKVVERAKWDAWNSVRHMTKEEAMNAYIDEIKNIVETMPQSETVQKFLDILGPFYEYVNDNNELINGNGVDDINNEQELDNQPLLTSAPITVVNGNDNKYIKLNGNNHVENSDDEEDYCDTTDYIDTLQTIKTIKSKLNNPPQQQSNGNHTNGGLNGYNDEMIINEFNSNSCSYNDDFNNNHSSMIPDSLIHQYGGESNSNQSQNQRPSRPNSTQSLPRGYVISSTGGGGGGAGLPPPPAPQPPSQPPNDPFTNLNYLQTDSNRQILMLLMRLQQDTNNVLTRLSYLEATVMSIQNSLQMNRLESSIQVTQRNNAAISTYSNNDVQNRGSDSLLNYLFRLNIDWKTLFFALIAPFVIRLAFFLVKKLKLLLKRNKKLL